MKDLLFPELAEYVEPIFQAFCPDDEQQLDHAINKWQGAVYFTPVLSEMFKAMGLSVKVKFCSSQLL